MKKQTVMPTMNDGARLEFAIKATPVKVDALKNERYNIAEGKKLFAFMLRCCPSGIFQEFAKLVVNHQRAQGI